MSQKFEIFFWGMQRMILSSRAEKMTANKNKFSFSFGNGNRTRSHLLVSPMNAKCRKMKGNLQFLTITYHRNKYWAVSGKQKSIFGCAIAISCSSAFEFIAVELPCLLVYRLTTPSSSNSNTSSHSRSENLCIYGWTFVYILWHLNGVYIAFHNLHNRWTHRPMTVVHMP